MTTFDSDLISATSIREYFHSAFATASRNQDVDVNDTTSVYVINLLSTFSQTAALQPVNDGGTHHISLAMIYADALAADGPEQRCQALQRLGDIALFIAGIFTDSLARKIVDVDYYIGMGGTAYASIHDSLRQRSDRFARVDLFEELGQKFSALVDVLAEISEMSGLKSNTDVLRTYEIWLRTGSERARKQLARCDIFPLTGIPGRTTH